MEKRKTWLLIALSTGLLASTFGCFDVAFLTVAESDYGTVVDPACLKVYVLSLADVGNRVAGNRSGVVEGVLEACKVGKISVFVGWGSEVGIYGEPEFMMVNVSITVQLVDSWETYRSLVESESNVIVINTHDEILPVPEGYSKTEWIAEIADFLMNRWGTWAHVGGYPFRYVRYQNGSEETWGEDGFKAFMSPIGKGNVDALPPTDENASATSTPKVSSKLSSLL